MEIALSLPRGEQGPARTASTAEGSVQIRALDSSGKLPLVVEPLVTDVNLARWLASAATQVDALLMERGALLFRGFHCSSPQELESLLEAMGRKSFAYTYRSTPRKDVGERVMSSTEYPANRSIPMHNEMSYTRSWPARVWFCCLQPAAEGGQTPLADSRAVWQRIPEAIRARFCEHGVMYVRNYGKGLDLPWQDVFQTDQEAEVEEYCRAAQIEFEWVGGGRLRTSQVCQADTIHPLTGERVWFNQAHLFHISALPAAARTALQSVLAPDQLPRNVYFGNGEPIPDEVLDVIRAAYDAETVAFDWEAGDVILVDNILAAHGRTPYRGARQVIVGMTD
jgi:alpha-ketoglutarate-dependent taurine dioxygenase